jgi:hypothetical protein
MPDKRLNTFRRLFICHRLIINRLENMETIYKIYGESTLLKPQAGAVAPDRCLCVSNACWQLTATHGDEPLFCSKTNGRTLIPWGEYRNLQLDNLPYGMRVATGTALAAQAIDLLDYFNTEINPQS